jgi:hypothetical protein
LKSVSKRSTNEQQLRLNGTKKPPLG